MSGLPQWLAEIELGEILLFFAAIGALVTLYRVFAPFIKAWQNFLIDWNGTPERPGVPARAGVPETLAKHGEQITANATQLTDMQEQLKKVQDQVTPNHGSELKLSEEVQGLRGEIAAAREDMAKIGADNERNANDLRRHLEDVPVIMAQILERAEVNSRALLRESGALQPDLFDEENYR